MPVTSQKEPKGLPKPKAWLRSKLTNPPTTEIIARWSNTWGPPQQALNWGPVATLGSNRSRSVPLSGISMAS
ncbi:MAG: hypothetical protein F4Y10_06235 [Synechococcus sp. SB0663_bin_10]|nr:hypothetical protein [Synechococcus sp. SB0663_bin_10]